MPSTRLLYKWFPHLSRPVVANAPMLGHATPAMAAAVHQAGGFGFIAGGMDFSDPKKVHEGLGKQLDETRRILKLSEKQALPIGLGLLTFHASAPQIAEVIRPLIAQYSLAALWLFAPSDPSPHPTLLPELKKLSPTLKIFVQVGTVKAAREAARDGADVIVAQGVDAGGHQFASPASTMTLVPEVADMLEREFPEREIALLAAGGIVDGRGLAAVLALGAEGAVLGTRFVVSRESPVSDKVRDVYLKTEDGGTTTVKSTLHDDVRGTGYWPAAYDGRAIITDSWRDLQKGMSMEESVKQYKAASEAGDPISRAVVWSGTGVGMIRDIKSASDIVKDVQAEALQIVQRLAKL